MKKISGKTVRQTSLDLLARREHSRYELLCKLRKRNFSDDEIIQTLDLFAEKGWQSDSRFAENYIHSRVSAGYGPIKISLELVERHVEDQIIELCLQSYQNHWKKLAAKVYKKRFGNSVIKNFKIKAKQMSFLQSRGFSLEQINYALEQVSDV